MLRIVVLAAAVALLAGGCTSTPRRPTAVPTTTPSASASAPGRPAGKISHVIIIMQENRSFDSYFGTYPGADGLPSAGGKFTVCVNNPTTGTCVSPFHDAAEVNGGGPHGATNATADIDGGKSGTVDHQVLSHDAYMKFIEDLFLGGKRLDPATDGRPDPRPDVRENASQLGNLMADFDFAQTPRPALILPLAPSPGPASSP